jgi:hypothetical protein
MWGMSSEDSIYGDTRGILMENITLADLSSDDVVFT